MKNGPFCLDDFEVLDVGVCLFLQTFFLNFEYSQMMQFFLHEEVIGWRQI